ncbi:hypothetical protein BMS3Abin11_00243 [bacterium BMS3Abin11]|nr:hypothetical protein BMS3Abin11_00243 [bacterium BMS3Abin11]HDZ78120.1 DUF4124 domain-containing protein [Gammaproteobacteria bacterium]
MPNLKSQSVRLIPILAFALLANSSASYAIAKCQDADGKWHYGDNAATVCGNAKITIIDKTGRKIEEIDEPLTLEVINAQKAEEKRKRLEEKLRTKRELEKKRILAIYPGEDSIIRARDDRLKGMDKNIRLQGELLDTMRFDMKGLEAKANTANEKEKKKLEMRIKTKQENIDDYYQVITHLRREREQTADKYKEILKEFRELSTE